MQSLHSAYSSFRLGGLSRDWKKWRRNKSGTAWWAILPQPLGCEFNLGSTLRNAVIVFRCTSGGTQARHNTTISSPIYKNAQRSGKSLRRQFHSSSTDDIWSPICEIFGGITQLCIDCTTNQEHKHWLTRKLKNGHKIGVRNRCA